MTTTLELHSPAFKYGHPIPAVYTRCDGEDLSPPLEWTGVPPNTKSLELIVDDPDAPDPKRPKMTWVHWVLYNLPPTETRLEDSMNSTNLPKGTMVGLNDWKQKGYGGPSPPIGKHRYFFKLFALDTILTDLGPNAKKEDVLEAMKGHVLDEAILMGTYQKAETS